MSRTVGIIIAAAVLLATACGEKRELRRDQQQYEVIQEGAGGAVTGTIHGPGETVPPVMPPLTGTSADTTTAFTLPTATTTSTAPPGTIAGTFTTEPSYPRPSRPRPSTPAPQPRPVDPQPVTPVPPPQPLPDPVPTQTQPEDPQPVPQPQPDEPEPEPEPQPQPPPPPPPPSTTDTAGDAALPPES